MHIGCPLSRSPHLPPSPSSSTLFLNSLRPGHKPPPPQHNLLCLHTLKPERHPSAASSSPPIAAPCCVSGGCGWGRMGLEVRSRKRFFFCFFSFGSPAPLISRTSARRKLFVHRHNASLFESSREKSAALSLSGF